MSFSWAGTWQRWSCPSWRWWQSQFLQGQSNQKLRQAVPYCRPSGAPRCRWRTQACRNSEKEVCLCISTFWRGQRGFCASSQLHGKWEHCCHHTWSWWQWHPEAGSNRSWGRLWAQKQAAEYCDLRLLTWLTSWASQCWWLQLQPWQQHGHHQDLPPPAKLWGIHLIQQRKVTF